MLPHVLRRLPGDVVPTLVRYRANLVFTTQRHIIRESSVDDSSFINAHRSEAPVAGALAFFEPRKTVPAFKYKSNGGRSELIREMSGGTGERIKR